MHSVDKAPLDGLRVLYLEDDALIAMNFVHTLEELGAIVDEYSNVEEARQALDAEGYDLAALDLRIREEMCYAVAQAARAKGLGVFFVTGYQKASLPPELQHWPVCLKPCTQAELIEAVGAALRLARPPQKA